MNSEIKMPRIQFFNAFFVEYDNSKKGGRLWNKKQYVSRAKSMIDCESGPIFVEGSLLHANAIRFIAACKNYCWCCVFMQPKVSKLWKGLFQGKKTFVRSSKNAGVNKQYKGKYLPSCAQNDLYKTGRKKQRMSNRAAETDLWRR